jgi:uncharacterized protein (TIGR02271 family)
MTEMIVAVFDTASAAEAAIRDLEAAGLPSAVIRRYVKDDPALRDYEGREPQRQGGFWSWLFGEDAPVSEYEVYDRSIAAGGTVVTVTVDEAHAARVTEILNQHAPLDIEERAAEYGIPSAAVAGARGTAGATEAGMASRMGTSAYDTEAGIGANQAPGATTGGGEAVIPLTEEQLQVGKRVVDRGTTRVRRYVVRTPVDESVTLRNEQVTIERRRPVAPGTPGVPEGAFEERVIEVRETAEEPVVSKTARVAEEVVVRKDVTEHTETVRDTVRREEVEVEKDGGPSADQSRSGQK